MKNSLREVCYVCKENGLISKCSSCITNLKKMEIVLNQTVNLMKRNNSSYDPLIEEVK